MDKGVLTAGFSTIFIGFSIVIGSTAAKVVNPFVLVTLGYLLSVVFLFILSKIVKEKLEIRKLFDSKKDLLSVVISRSVIGAVLLNFGFSMVPAVRAVFLLRLEPVLVFLISLVLLKEKIMPRKVLLLCILLFGALVFTTSGSFDLVNQLTAGDLIIIGALAFLAYSYIPSSKLSKKINPNTLTIGANLLPAIIFLPIILIFIPSTLSLQTDSVYLVLAYTLTFYVFGLFLWFKSLKTTKPWIVASVLSLEPIAGGLLAFFWLGQALSAVQFLGATIMVASTFFIARENAKK